MKKINFVKNILRIVSFVLIISTSSPLWAASVHFYCVGGSLQVGADTNSTNGFIQIAPEGITQGPNGGALNACYYAGGNVYSLGIDLSTPGAKSVYANALLSKSLNILVRIYVDSVTCRVESLVLQ